MVWFTIEIFKLISYKKVLSVNSFNTYEASKYCHFTILVGDIL